MESKHTILEVENFKDIQSLDKQVCKSELHGFNNPKIIMSKENIEKFISELKHYNMEIPNPLTFNTMIGPIPIEVKDL